MFTEYQVRAALLKTLELALSEMKVSGFEVKTRNPQVMANADRVVLLDRLYTRRNGFQSREYAPSVRGVPSSPLNEVEVWCEEIGWQISVLRRRDVTDDINTFTGNDVAKAIVAWFNSGKGAEAMRNRTDVPMAPIFCRESRVRPYSDNSDIHQMEATADLRTIVLQTLGNEVPDIKAWEAETHPI